MPANAMRCSTASMAPSIARS